MRQKILFILILILSLHSCSDIIEKLPNDLPISNITTRSYPGDNEYDALGYGCDVAKDLFSAKIAVVDNDLIKEVYGDRIARDAISPDLVQYGSMNYTAGATSADYLKSASQTKNITFNGSYKAISCNGSISTYYSDSSSLNSQYSYVCFERYIQKRAYTYSLGIESLRKNFLTTHFKSALNNFSPQTIVSKYGTHVYSNVKLGGKLSLLYKMAISDLYAETKSSKTRAITVSLTGLLDKVLGLSLTNSLDITEEERQQVKQHTNSAQYVISTIGGDNNIPMTGIVIDAEKTNYTFDSASWERSVGQENTTTGLIDFASGSLIPIWEFVDDPIKREALKKYVIKYIEENELKIDELIPLYLIYHNGYHCLAGARHTKEQLAKPNRVFYGFLGYLLKNPTEKAIPLYSLINPNVPNNYDYYCIAGEEAMQQQMSAGRIYDGIFGYILKAPDTNSVPLYCLCNPHEYDYFCVSNEDALKRELSKGCFQDGIYGYLYYY